MLKYSSLLIVLALCSCASGVSKPDNSTAVNAVGNFMQSMYKGKFEEANSIMLQDSANKKCLNERKFNYNQVFTKAQKLKYKRAAIVFNKTIPSSDTVTLFELSDPISGKKIPTVKVVKKDKEWLVDFAYTCSGNL